MDVFPYNVITMIIFIAIIIIIIIFMIHIIILSRIFDCAPLSFSEIATASQWIYSKGS